MADSLRTVIGSTLAIGALLTGVLVLRGTRFAPEWLRPPAPESSTSTNRGLGAPVLPPPPQPAAVTDVPPPPATASTEPSASTAGSVASATPEPSASTPEPVASASAGRARRGGAAQPAEPAVVELPADFRYSPQGPGNLTFPVSPPAASTAAPH
ncbi:MAG TPA: hypothetical protein VMI75_14200 [Polyangiaceae bacterium]|nr:hypothetical protein [Polyangiaceae bacterium]